MSNARRCLALLLMMATFPAVDSVLAAEVQVILLGGQSNMDGRANDADLNPPLNQPQTDVKLFHSEGGTLPANRLVNLAPGSGTDFGPEVTLGRTLADEFPDERFVLVKHAIGGTNLYADWDPDTGNQYMTFTNTVQAALQAITDAGDTPVLAGMVWMQGERDAKAGRTRAQYEADLTEFIGEVRNDFFGGDDAPFVIGRLSDKQTNIPASQLSAIQTAQDNVAESVTNVEIVNTDEFGMKSDNLHLNAVGQQSLGSGFAEKLKAYLQEPVPGDYDGDGILNVADHAVWRETFGSTSDLRADGNTDGIIDAADYTFWRDQFAMAQAGSASRESVIPEPTSCLSIGITGTLMLLKSRASAIRREVIRHTHTSNTEHTDQATTNSK